MLNYFNWYFKNFRFLRFRLKLVDRYTARKVDWINKQTKLGAEYRGDTLSVIRKYAHMLDKGLQNEKREKGRSKEIYAKTKMLFNEFESNSGLRNEPDLCWAKDIINKYERFQYEEVESEELKSFFDPKYIKPEISFLDLENLIKTRRTIRYFEDKHVDDDILEKIFELVNWAPHSCNRQNVRIYYTTDKKLIKKCLPLNSGATGMNEPAVFASICCNTESYYYPLEYNVAYIDASLGAQNIILGAHAFGLGCCVLNWSHASVNEEIELRRKLSIQETDLVIFNLVMGYPKKGAPTPIKKTNNRTIMKVT